MEEWRPIKGNLQYAVSDCGRVWSWVSGRYLNGSIDSGGYHQVNLAHRGRGRGRKIHRLVLAAFCDAGWKFLGFRNKDTTDCRLGNLLVDLAPPQPRLSAWARLRARDMGHRGATATHIANIFNVPESYVTTMLGSGR